MKLTKNALTVLERRYLAKDENGNVMEKPKEMFERVANYIAQADKIYDERANVEETAKIFYNIMADLEFIPNSPTLMNAGRELGQLSACFVLPIEDSMEGIFDAIKNSALIHKSGGGTGFSFSRLRSKGSTVKSTGGVASGPISFMKVFNAATEAVKQGGTRRGANMGILRIDHPDIMEFIEAKQDTSQITNFNISVGITEDFMKSVQRGEYYNLIDPHSNKVTGSLNAKKVFKHIVDMAWNTGEPGIVFLDRINKTSTIRKLGEIESTNPCFHPDTMISTKYGLMKIEELYEKYNGQNIFLLTDDRIINEKIKINGREYFDNGVTLREGIVIKNGIKKTLVVKLKNGQMLKVTPEHKILTDRGWKEAKDLKVKDNVLIQSGEGYWAEKDEIGSELGFLMGWVTGDGWLTSDEKTIGMIFNQKEKYIMERIQVIGEKYGAGSGIVNKRENGIYQLLFKRSMFVDKIKSLGLEAQRAHIKRVPKSIFTAKKDTVSSYLNGLFSADGTVNYIDEAHRDIRLTSSSLELLRDVQLILLNLGIFSNIYNRTKKEQVSFKYETINGELRHYKTRPYFELIINGNSITQFRKVIGEFEHKDKSKKLISIDRKSRKMTKFITEVISVEEGEKIEVYDIKEDITNSLIANGVVAHNCGEQPLLPFESCNLGSINLAKMVKKGEEGYEVDYDRLEEVVYHSVHFLDNVIDMNKYPLKEIDEMTKKTRKIGLGVMGFADLLFYLKIPYNSQAAVDLAEKIMGFIDKKGKEKSKELAEKRGVFLAYELSSFNEEGIKMRNSTVTTIAPTGTISIIAGASSGIEPLFAISFMRNVMDDDKLIEVHPYFEKMAKERGFYSEELMEKIAREGSITNIEEIPEDIKKVFVTAHDISPFWHIKMQGAFQNHVDNAVSKTVNFGNDATKEEVEEVYMLAYKLGCKGVTIYRDGSRENQVLSTNKKEEKKDDSFKGKPRMRPEITKGITEKVKIGCGNLYITVNYDENGICEVFTNLGRAGGCPSQSEATSRLISISLRSGMEVEEVVEQLKGIRCHSTLRQKATNNDIKVLSCPDAIGKAIERAMKTYDSSENGGFSTNVDININTSDTASLCPECGSDIEHEGGCTICRSCGYSKCN